MRLTEGEVRTSVSIGSVRFEGGMETTAEDLLRSADLAMYAAKEQGRSRHVAFNPTMHAAAVRRLALKTDLDRAVALMTKHRALEDTIGRAQHYGAMAIDALATPGVYFGTSTGQLFASADEGESWGVVAEHLPDVLCVRAATLG